MKKILHYLKIAVHFYVFLFITFISFLYFYIEFSNDINEKIYDHALMVAKSSFDKDVVYRKWAELEGGVYVPITDYTKPNPYLEVPNRDVETKNGLKLTLVNPAYMTRMVHELEFSNSLVKGHITSLNPIRPENKPDDWEIYALKSFQKGQTSKHEIVIQRDKKVFRFMAPFIVEKPCLKCHEKQGYKVGDIRGGISITFPYDNYEKIISQSKNKLLMQFSIIYFLIFVYLISVSLFYYQSQNKLLKEFENTRRLNNLLKENEQKLKLFYDYSPFAVSVTDAKTGKYIYVNKKFEEITGYKIDEILNKTSIELNFWKHTEERKKFITNLFESGIVEDFFIEINIRNNKSIHTLVNATLSDDRTKIISIIQDISKSFLYNKMINTQNELFLFLKFLDEKIDIYDNEEIINNSLKSIANLTLSQISLVVFYDEKNINQIKIFNQYNYNHQNELNELAINFNTLSLFKSFIAEENNKTIYYKNYANKFLINEITIDKLLLSKKIKINNSWVKFIIANKRKDYDEVDENTLNLFVEEVQNYFIKRDYLKSLKENRRFLNTLINNLPGFIYRCKNDKNWTMIYISENVNETLGYDKNILINNEMVFNDIILPEFREYVWNEIQKCIKEKTNYELEYKIKHKNGNEIWVWERGLPIFDENGNLTYLEGFITNINDRKILENNLKESETKLRLFVENAPDLIYRFELYPTPHFSFVSNSSKDIVGYTPEEHYNDPKLGIKIIHDEDKEKLLNLFNSSEEKIKEPTILRWKKKNGDIAWLQQKNRPIYDENNNLIAIEGIATDITKIIEYENELLKFKNAVEQTRISIVITDIEDRIEFCNKFLEENTGYKFEEIKGKKTSIFSSGYHTKEFYQELWDTILSGLTWRGTLINKKKNGEIFYEDALITPIKNKNGIITNFLAVKDDITKRLKIEDELNNYQKNLEKLVEDRTNELKQLNEELVRKYQTEKELKLKLQEALAKEKELNEELVRKYQTEKELELKLQEALAKEKELNELKTKFIASVSHEFRTPLTALISSFQIIKKYGNKLEKEKIENHYHKIEMVVNHLVNLLDEVLLISRADREVLTNNPTLINLSKLINFIIDIQKPLMKKGQKISLSKNIKEDEIFYLDEKLLQHIINNLLSNALKYSPENSLVELIINKEKEFLVIKVIDKGYGIPEEDITYIFDAFYRSESNSHISGVGLGLNIVKRCVEILKGNISVQSKINEGSIFIVKIPIENYEEENTNN